MQRQQKIFSYVLAAAASIALYNAYSNTYTFFIMVIAAGYSAYLCAKDMVGKYGK